MKMSLNIIEPICEYKKEFNTPDEFNAWFQKNKDEVSNMTTHKLNKLYNVKGYHITRIKDEVMLKKWDKERNARVGNFDVKLNEVHEQIDKLTKEVAEIKKALNGVISFLHGEQSET